jgi:hypothetical protein
MTTPVAAVDHPDGTRSYPVLDRATGETVHLPNITGIIGLLDPKHICEWVQKMMILGVALREDIALQVAAAHLLPEGKPRNAELRRVAQLAKQAGELVEKGHSSADRGTALHAITERLDELVPPGQIATVDELGLPKSAVEIAREYVAAMAGVEIVHTEVTVASLAHRYAGTGDRIIRFRPLDAWQDAFDQWDLGRGCFVFDNKFGRVHDTVALQLAAIANAESIWDPHARMHEALPVDLRTDVGFVFNPDKGLVPVPLDGAFEAFVGLANVKRWQDRSKAPEVTPATAEKSGIAALADHPRFATGEPVHISEALPKVIAAIPEADPFAGLPAEDGAPQIDRAAKRRWLIERIDVLRTIPGGVEQVAARWPADVLTFKQSDTHTADELELIAKAITAAEAEVRAPFPETDDPTDPRTIVVANDDPRVTGLVERIKNLPPDLILVIEANAKAAGTPNLSRGRITEAHLADLEPIVAGAENEYAPRAKRINDELAMAAEKGIGEDVLCATLGVKSAKHIHGHQVDQLVTLVDAIGLNLFKVADGVLVVDNPASILGAEPYRDSRKAVWDAGKQIAKQQGIESPKDSDAALAHPLIAAYLAAM